METPMPRGMLMRMARIAPVRRHVLADTILVGNFRLQRFQALLPFHADIDARP
jgi:hypothetical protein